MSEEIFVSPMIHPSRLGYDKSRPFYTPCDRGALLDVVSTKDSEKADVSEMRQILGAINYLVSMTRHDLQYGITRLQVSLRT